MAATICLRPLLPCRLSKLLKDHFRLSQKTITALIRSDAKVAIHSPALPRGVELATAGDDAPVVRPVNTEHDESLLVFPDDEVKIEDCSLKPNPLVCFAAYKPKSMQVAKPNKNQLDGTKFSRWLNGMEQKTGISLDSLFAIGRLDKPTTGLILLTNDGDLDIALRTNEIDKTYSAVVRNPPEPTHCEQLMNGVSLGDGPAVAHSACIIHTDEDKRIAGVDCTKRYKDAIKVSTRQGRFRVVRRMVAAVGLPVQFLHRISFGPIEMESMGLNKAGPLAYIQLSPEKLEELWQATGGHDEFLLHRLKRVRELYLGGDDDMKSSASEGGGDRPEDASVDGSGSGADGHSEQESSSAWSTQRQLTRLKFWLEHFEKQGYVLARSTDNAVPSDQATSKDTTKHELTSKEQSPPAKRQRSEEKARECST